MLGECKKEERERLVALMLLFFLVNSTILCVKNVAASTGSSAVLDLFTQKVPFSGNGPNATSDAFQPQELIILYASVTYNGAPLKGMLVSYQVKGPANEFSNETVLGSSTTNGNGLAAFSFRLPWPDEHPEEIVFGTWFAIATVSVAQETVQDTLTFQVGWILQIISIATLNSELVPKTMFLRQSAINFNLTVKNIAMIEKSAAVTIEVIDAAGYPIISIMKEDLTFQSGESYVNGSSWIPSTTAIGNATVWAAIYTALPEEGGVLYSPAASAEFGITEELIHDVGVTNVVVSPNSVNVGGIVNIFVTVKNNGTATESFSLSAYYNSSLIQTLQVNALAPGSQENVAFSWNTSSVSAGLYQISASAPLAGDTSPGDNTFTDGFVHVMTPIPPSNPRALYIVLLIILLLFLLALLALLVLRRRKTDESETLEQLSFFT